MVNVVKFFPQMIKKAIFIRILFSAKPMTFILYKYRDAFLLLQDAFFLLLRFKRKKLVLRVIDIVIRDTPNLDIKFFISNIKHRSMFISIH